MSPRKAEQKVKDVRFLAKKSRLSCEKNKVKYADTRAAFLRHGQGKRKANVLMLTAKKAKTLAICRCQLLYSAQKKSFFFLKALPPFVGFRDLEATNHENRDYPFQDSVRQAPLISCTLRTRPREVVDGKGILAGCTGYGAQGNAPHTVPWAVERILLQTCE